MIIYKIINTITQKIYIGKTIKTLEERKKTHLKCLKNGKNTLLYNSMRKYGIENFEWSEIVKCDNIEILNELEKFYIEKFESFKNGYNLTKGGDGGDTISTKSSYVKKNQGVKLGNIPWNKGLKMKEMGYDFYEKRPSGRKHTDVEKNKISNSIKKSEKYYDSLKKRKPAKQVVIIDDLGGIWYKLKDFIEFSKLSRFLIMKHSLNEKWVYNNRTYEIIFIK